MDVDIEGGGITVVVLEYLKKILSRASDVQGVNENIKHLDNIGAEGYRAILVCEPFGEKENINLR